MNGIFRSIRGIWPALAALVVCSATGCTSAISTAYLRDAWWDAADHASESESSADVGEPADGEAAIAADDSAEDPAAARADEERRAAAIDETVARLARLGDLDEPTRATLMETLQRTQQEDWPAVVEAFAASLESSGGSSRAAAEDVIERASPVTPASYVAAKADVSGHAPPALPPPAPEPPAAVASESPVQSLSVEPMVDAESEAAVGVRGVTTPQPPAPEEPVAPPFAVRNACFASRVQGWGVVDRFVESRFRPGQEVIVYFELDSLSASESPAGHTTCIDATLALVDGDGRVVHDWSFEPIAETCRAKRHDYFARYVIRIPESVPAGECRIDVAVVDTLAGTTARAALPLAISGN